jgi:hypothetical protein
VSDDASEPDLVCSCCGSSLGARNDDASCDEAPAREDAGTVACRVCGLITDAGVPYPDALVAPPEFVGAKVALLLERLSPEGRAFFLALPYERRARITLRLVRLGVIP